MAKAKKKRSPKSAPQPVNPAAKALKISVEAARYRGYEPEWEGVEVTSENRNGHLAAAFNWYNYNFTSKDAKAFIIEYLKLNDRKDEIKGFKKASDNAIGNSYGWLARMTLMGWVLSEEEQQRLDTAIADAIEASVNNAEEVEETDEDKEKKKFNIQERMREKCAEAGGEIEGMLDDYIAAGAKAKHKFDPLTVLKVANILPAHANDEIKHWESIKEEFVEAHAGKDKDLAEAYEHLGKIQLRNIIKFIDEIIAAYHGYVAYKKATKKTRKRKVKSPQQLVQKLKFMKEFKELNLESEKPAKIVGAKEMFVYDTKKRKLMYFVADEYAGALSVRNNIIEGFDANKSVQKTVRKPEEQLKEFMKASKPNSRKFFQKMKSVEQKFSGRFNENIVILKVW